MDFPKTPIIVFFYKLIYIYIYIYIYIIQNLEKKNSLESSVTI
jgi:hypothetical protein